MIFLPNQFEGQVLVVLEFVMDGGEFGRRMNPPARLGKTLTKQNFVDTFIGEIFRQRPMELGGLGQFQISVNSGLDDRATAGNLVLRQS